MGLGENIYGLRTEKNMSQGDLADVLEVSRQSVSKWENNSAVPELDKLIKLAEVFGVTIDALVTGAPPRTDAVKAEAKVIYIEKPAQSQITATQILGIVLTVCSLLALVLSLLLMTENEWSDSPFLLCLPAAVVGIICIAAKRHAGYFSALAVYLLAWFTVTVLAFPGVGTVAQLVCLGVIICGAGLLVYTVVRFRALKISRFFKILILAVLAASVLVCALAIIPPVQQEVETWEEFTATVDASVSPD